MPITDLDVRRYWRAGFPVSPPVRRAGYKLGRKPEPPPQLSVLLKNKLAMFKRSIITTGTIES